MKFVDFLIRRLQLSYQHYYGDTGAIPLGRDSTGRSLESRSWFYPNTDYAFKLLSELNHLGYYRDFEITDFSVPLNDNHKGEQSPVPVLAKVIQSEIRNSESLAAFCITLQTRLQRIDPLLHLWHEERGAYWRIYYDFSASRTIGFVPLYPLVQLCAELQEVFALQSTDLQVAVRQDSFHNPEQFRSAVPFLVDTTRGHSFVQFEIPYRLVRARHHNPLLIQPYRAVVEELIDYFCTPSTFVDSITASVLHYLAESGTLIEAEAMALRMNMSPATFYRRLQDAGVTYRTICSSVRLQLARRLLAEDKVSLQNVAKSLGFAGAAQFSRFFKDLDGQAPSSYRQRISLGR